MNSTPRTEAQFIPHPDEPTTPTMQIHDEVIALRRENAELRTDGQRWQNEHLRLLAENAELREALNLAFSIPQMSDQQLGDLIENCRKIIGSKP